MAIDHQCLFKVEFLKLAIIRAIISPELQCCATQRKLTLLNSPALCTLVIWRAAEMAPALWPQSVTWLGSPPKFAMLSLTHCSASAWSYTATCVYGSSYGPFLLRETYNQTRQTRQTTNNGQTRQTRQTRQTTDNGHWRVDLWVNTGGCTQHMMLSALFPQNWKNVNLDNRSRVINYTPKYTGRACSLPINTSQLSC